jgi:hypothetical protein
VKAEPGQHINSSNIYESYSVQLGNDAREKQQEELSPGYQFENI